MQKLIASVLVVATGAALVFVNLNYERSDAPQVAVEPITRRTLQQIVSASGTIQPKLSVDISSSVAGRVTRLEVEEGERVTAGQFLLEIDPESVRSAVTRSEAALRAAQSAQEAADVRVQTAAVSIDLARETLERQQELWEKRLISREAYDQATREVELQQHALEAREVEVQTAVQRVSQERALLDSAKYDVTQVTMISPIDGVVSRRNVEMGESVLVGTMSNPDALLLTIADFSLLEAEVSVDEIDVPAVRPGQLATVTIDAFPDHTYDGRVTEVSISALQAGGQQGGAEATTYGVVVTLDEETPGVRAGFACTVDITTASRADVIAVPIQATTIREIETDDAGEVVRAVRLTEDQLDSLDTPAGLGGDTTRSLGVFVVRQDRAEFVPIETGVSGERFVEVLSGLNEDDMVITGPFSVARNLGDGDLVRASGQSAAR
jgi:HlyD family secretion protein